MTVTRKRHSAAFKARVALEAAKQTRILAELSGTFQVHSVQISKWKKQVLDGIESLFRDGRRHDHDESQAIQAELYEQLGRLKMEVEWLKKTMRRHGAKNADYRGGVTCLYDTQLLGACLHASECGGRYRPGAVRGMPDVPIAPPATGPPEGWAAVGFVSPASFNRGLCARLLRVLGS